MSSTPPVNLPDRLALAQLPTPISRLDPAVTASLIGGTATVDTVPTIFIKRDDLTGLIGSGNKIRKLEYVLADARAAGASHVITCGGIQSNHCRATAACCARLGMHATLLLRVKEPAAEPDLTGNLLLDRLVGARVIRISFEEYRRRAELMEGIAESLRAAGHTPYVVPEGASSARGSLGYVNCVRELGLQIPESVGDEGFDSLVVATGSGGTAAGLDLGLALYPEVSKRLHAFCVCDNAEYFRDVCGRLLAEALELADVHEQDDVRRAPVLELDDEFIGPGYSIPYPEMMADLAALARATGIVLDPAYTGKAWHGLLQTLRVKGLDAFGQRICFLHTGGLYGLMAQADALRDHLAPYDDAGVIPR